MKLDSARLCLDCEELHEEQECPSCGSEAFAFLTRWVAPAAERRPAARAAERPPAAHQPRTQEQLEAYRQLLEGKPAKGRGRLITGGLIGLAAAVGVAGWAWKAGRARPDGDEGSPRPDATT